jgi:hypothetical protein
MEINPGKPYFKPYLPLPVPSGPRFSFPPHLSHLPSPSCLPAHAADEHLIVSYSRKEFLQTGDGHFSPIGGYSEADDLVLILDTARFKYPPHWVPLNMLHRCRAARTRVHACEQRGDVGGGSLACCPVQCLLCPSLKTKPIHAVLP